MRKMRTLRRIVAAAAALQLLLLVHAPAASASDALSKENTMVFRKEILVFNTAPAGAPVAVHYPNVSYVYSIAGANVEDAAPTVTDSKEVTGRIYNGVGAGTAVTVTERVDFSDEDTVLSSVNGAVASRPVTVTVNPNDEAFEHAGIYRYLITETEAADAGRASAGVARPGDYRSTRYLDLYLRRAVGQETGRFVIYGFVLLESDEPGFDLDGSENADVIKSNGFVASAGNRNEPYEPTDVDYYNTYNLKIMKMTDGPLADTNHAFPMKAEFRNAVGSRVTVDYGISGETTAHLNDGANPDGLNTIGGEQQKSIMLSAGSSTLICGIPAGSTVRVTEYNNSYDNYFVEMKATGGQKTEVIYGTDTVSAGEASKAFDSADNTATLTEKGTENTQVTVTNTIAMVSPTGYVIRFLPFGVMAVFAILILIFFRFYNREEDEDEI